MTEHEKIVQQVIPAKLKEIEEREHVRVIYVRPLEYYLRLDKTRDVIA